VLENIRALNWLNSEDFEQAISVARKYYPEPPRKEPPVPPPAPPEVIVSRLENGVPKNTVAKNGIHKNGISKDDIAGEPTKAPPKPVVRKFDMRIEGSRAKFIPVWRIRIHGR
jgi:hypothetical protein